MTIGKGKREGKPAGEKGSLRNRLYGLVQLVGDAQIMVYASSGAFYLFLSLFPSAALLCSILPLLPFDQAEVLEYISTVLPSVMQDLLRSIVNNVYSYSAAAFSISALLLLWSAGRAFYGLMQGLSRVYGAPPERNFLKLRGLSSLYMLAFFVAMLLTLGLSLFQRTMMDRMVRHWPQSGETVELMLRLRFLPAMVMLAAFFSCLYRFLPAGKRRFRDQVPGALLVSALWMLLSWAFSLYLSRFGTSSVYGSLATVAFALLWIQWCMALMLLGGCFNVWLGGGRRKRTAETE
jgi:membrane protein